MAQNSKKKNLKRKKNYICMKICRAARKEISLDQIYAYNMNEMRGDREKKQPPNSHKICTNGAALISL